MSEEGHIVRNLTCATRKWFSSTRAELIAILLALLTIPSERRAKIRTDNKAAILAIKRGLENSRVRQCLKTKNRGLITTIVEIIKIKVINIC